METVFVCSRLRGEVSGNILKSHRYATHQLSMGRAPFAPHGYYTQFLDDTKEVDRQLGIIAAQAYLATSDRVAVYIVGGAISEGMELEIILAIDLGKEIEWWFDLGEKFERLHHVSPGTMPTPRELLSPTAFVNEVSGFFGKALATGTYDDGALDDLLGTTLAERDRELEEFWESRKSSEED